MPQFDLESYINRRQELAGADKAQQLLEAKQRKLLELSQATSLAPTEPTSWAGKLGLNGDSLDGGAVNFAASLAYGVSRGAGLLASLPSTMNAAADEASVPEATIQAYNRMQQGQATPADMALLNQNVQRPNAVQAKAGTGTPVGKSALETLKNAAHSRETARSINETFDIKSILDNSNRDALTRDLGDGFNETWNRVTSGWDQATKGEFLAGTKDMASGLGALLVNAGEAAINNKQAAAEYIIENAPQLAIGMIPKVGRVMLGASNVGYAADYYNKAIENYAAKNDGALPSEEERHKMAGTAATLAIAEHASDSLMLGVGKASKAVRAVTGAAEESAEQVAKTGLKQALLNTAKATVGGTASEAATEGYQTWAEGELEGKPASAQDIYTGAVIGGIAGGGMSGGMRALAEAAEATPEHTTKREQAVKEKGKFEDAVAAGDHTVYLNERSDDYDPSAAVRVLYAVSQKEDATPEIKQQNLQTASEVVSNLEQQQEDLKTQYDSITEAGLKKTEATLAGFEQQLAATDPADTDTVAALTEGIEMAKEQIAGFSSVIPANKKTAAKLETQLSRIDRQLTDARSVRDEMVAVEASKVKSADVEADVKLADSGNTEAASRIINLSMAMPSKLSAQAAANLASNTQNGLNEQQRSYLRAFSAARQTENQLSTMKKVSQEILSGTKSNLGIAQYRTRIAAAVASNDQKSADRYVGLLDNFRADHIQKAQVAKEAFDASVKDGQVRQVLRTPDNAGWYATTSLVPEKVRVANGGLEIHPVKSKNLVPSLQVEAQALTNAHAELTAAVGLRFGTGTVQSNPSPAASLQASATTGTATPENTTLPSAKQTESALVKNNLPQKSVEPSARPSLRDGESVAPQQRKEVVEENKSASPPSPSSTTPAPIAVAGAPAQGSVVSSAPAAQEEQEQEQEEGEFDLPGLTGEATASAETTTSEANSANTPDAAAGQAAEQQDGTSEASDAPAAEAAPAGLRLINTYKKLTGKLQEIWNAEGFNPIAQFLKQDLNNERYKTARPLAALSSFLASWNDNAMLPLQYLEEGDSLLEPGESNNRKRAALNDLQKHLNKWVPLVSASLKEHGGSKKYLSEDLMQYLVERTEDGKLDLDENIKTAIAYAGYSWAVEQASSPAWKTDTEIAKMHGFGKETTVSEKGRRDLRHLAGFEDRVIHELGETVVQALGLVNDPNAAGDILPRLKMALGTHVLMLLSHKDVNLAKRSVVKHADVQSYFGDNSDTNADDDTAAGEEAVLNNEYAGFNTYVRFVREDDTRTLTPAGQQIRDANKESGGIVDKLFGADKAPRFASLTPVKFRQKFAKGTQQEISKKQAKTIQESMDDPFRPIPEMMDLFIGLGRAGVLTAAGHVDLESGFVHEHKKDAAEAQNMNLENQFDLGMEGLGLDPMDLASRLTDEVLTTPRYVEQSIWKNFRAGFMNASLNPQTSKIHRVLFAREGWTAKIDMADTAMKNEFKIAVAMGLGVKTDQQRNDKTMAKFEAKLAEPDVAAALEVLRRGVILKDNTAWTDANRTLVANVARAEEGMQTLQALVAYAKFMEAEKSGDASVDVTLLVGVDGKTNGPMLTHLALGAAANLEGFYTLLNRGGFYSTADGQADHYSQWYEGEESQDLYEDLGAKTIANVMEKIKPAEVLKKEANDIKNADPAERGKLWREYFKYFTIEDLNAIEMVTKALVKDGGATKYMRNLIKVPLTSFAFGSSLKKSIANMQASFISGFYDTLEDLAKDDASPAEVAQFIQNMNRLIAMGNRKASKNGKFKAIEGQPIPVNMPIKELLKFTLKPDQQAALNASFKRIIGDSVEATMNEYFETFIARRRQLNNTIQSAYQVYEAAYATAKMAEIERLMDNDELAFRISKAKDGTETRVPWHDLSPNQEKKVRDNLAGIAPVMHNHYSIKDNNLKTGLFMAKSKVNVSKSPLYTSKVYVNRNIGRMVKNKTTGEYEVKSYPHLVSQAQTRVEQSPGVAGAAYAIHSSDSSIMHQMLARVKGSLNVHDEGGNGVHKVRELARELNAATAETFLEYSPAREAALMLARTISGLAQQVRAGTMGVDAVVALARSWEESYNAFLPAEFQVSTEEAMRGTLKSAMENAFQADHMRLSALAILKSVDQYVWEGGQFVADDAFRARAKKKLADLKLEASPATIADLEFLVKTFSENRTLELKPAKWVDIKTEERSDKDTSPAADSSNTIAELGTSRVKHDADLVAQLEKRPTMPVKQMVAILRGMVGKDDFRGKLLSQLERTMGNVTIQYVTGTTPKDSIPVGPSSSNARGWYVEDTGNGQSTIYILSPDYRFSGVTPELLLHEMTHAALVNIVYTERTKRDGDPDYGITGDPSYTSPALELVDELERLREQTQAFIEANPEKLGRFSAIIQNVDELIAYGMTNPSAQSILKEMPFKSRTGGNKLVNAMKEFVDLVTGLIFGRRNDTVARGMDGLIQNVAGLFEAVAQERTPSRGRTRSADMAGFGPDLSTTAIYSALGQLGASTVSAGFDTHLRNVLDGIVTKLHGPFGVFKDLVATTQATDPMDIWIEAKNTGVAPFGSQVLGQPFTVSEQEAFVLEQVEATMRAVLTDNEGQTTVAYRELVKLYDEVAGKLTKADFTAAGIDASLYDFVFNVRAGANNRSDYLSRFVALGLANEQFAGMLGFATASAPTTRVGMSLVDRLYNIFEQILTYLNGRFTQTFAGQNADDKLASLANSLVQIEIKKRHRLAVQKSAALEHVEDVFRSVSVKARGAVEKFGKSRFFQNSSSNVVGAAGTVISMVAGDRVEQLLEGINTLRDQHFHKRHGLAAGLVNEVRGANATNLPFHALLRAAKNNERQRKELIDNTARVVVESFANKGANLTKQDKEAISAVMLRTDMSSLLGQYTVDEIANLLRDPKALEQAITSFETQLAASPFRIFMMNAAEALGLYKAKGLVRSVHLLMNAGNIARLYGTKHVRRVTEQQAQAMEKIIDPLVSLYALRHTKAEDRAAALALFQSEGARTDKGNGVEMTLKLHKALQEQSKERLFQGSEALYMKGYTPEIYNPYMDVIVAPVLEKADLEARGYTQGAQVESENGVDPDTEVKHIYSLRDGGLQPHLTGVMSYTGMTAKGSKKHNGNVSLLSTVGMQNASMMHTIGQKKAAQIDAMFTQRIDPAKVSKNFLAPVLDVAGGIVNYRYLMNDLTKDKLLERDNRFERVLGAMAGSIYDKETTPVHNRAAVEALKAQYDAEFATKATSYIRVGATSPDPEMREIWRLLPESTKQAVREVWGREEMLVRIDLLDINFGYRKLSLANSFQKDEDERKIYEQLFVDFWAYFLGPKAELRIRQAEDIWQTIVREAKDIIVVKSGITLLGNLMSNVTELMWFGVPAMDIIRHHRVAMKGAMAYRKDSRELFELENALSTKAYAGRDAAEMEKRAIRLRDSLARNPVRHLIDAGLMPTIVEDVAGDDETYSYKSRFTRFLEERTEKVNPKVVAAARMVYMTHDTALYRAMSYTTQLSDFVARYTLYQHMTNRPKNPMKADEAIQLASDAFINYDVPTHRTMQYLNDTGLIWFTKYYLRIQKVILHLYRENPGRALALLTLNTYFDTIPTLMDSAAMSRIGNPFGTGALNYASSLDQLATVKVAMSPFN